MDNIDKYIESLSLTHSPITLDKYKKMLIKINKEISLDSSEQGIWDFIEGTGTKLQTKRTKQFTVKGYRAYYSLDTSYFTFKLKKSNTGEYVNSATPEAVEKEIKKLPDNYLELIDKIENRNHKLLLRLVTDYNEVLRCDLAFVKISDITDNEIVIKETRKTKMAIKIEIKTEDLKLIDYSKEYLINLNTIDRSKGYTDLVQRITKKYLGLKLSQKDFRGLKATELFKKNEHLPIKDQLILLKQDASKRAHTSSVALSHYIKEADDINVSIKYKTKINILDNEDKVIGCYNIEEIVTAMKLFRLIKDIAS